MQIGQSESLSMLETPTSSAVSSSADPVASVGATEVEGVITGFTEGTRAPVETSSISLKPVSFEFPDISQ